MRKRTKMIITILLIFIIAAAIALGGFAAYGSIQMSKIPGLSFREALQYTLKDQENAMITVGVIKDGVSSFTVYGENGAELPPIEHSYEIGSVTKTFTAALVQKAIGEGKIKLEDTVDDYLKLPSANAYPTIRELISHTSGYKSYYFEAPMIENFFKGRNDFCGIHDKAVLDRLSKLSVEAESYPFAYSNFGYAVLGLVLEAVYDREYTDIVNQYAQAELGLESTYISDGKGDLSDYWSWEENDSYLAAGGLVTTITDMLNYTKLQLSQDSGFFACHKPLAEITNNLSSNQKMGIYMDEIGMGWIIDKQNGIVWHNGATGNFNCYLGFAPQENTAVIVLSNLSPRERIPATVLGIKLLGEIKKEG